MASADEVAAELLGTNPPANHHDVVVGRGGPSPYTVRTVQSKVTETLKEVTLWLPRRTLAALVAKRGKTDTTLGHAIDAASYGDINYRILAKIAEKVGADISGIQ